MRRYVKLLIPKTAQDMPMFMDAFISIFLLTIDMDDQEESGLLLTEWAQREEPVFTYKEHVCGE